MKVIDLLNKIAKGEEVPNKIKIFGEEFNYDGYDYYSLHSSSPLMSYVGEDYLRAEMNYEVEILEEEKKIPEKIPLNYADDRKPEEVYEYLRCSYNQLIDYLKSKGE